MAMARKLTLGFRGALASFGGDGSMGGGGGGGTSGVNCSSGCATPPAPLAEVCPVFAIVLDRTGDRPWLVDYSGAPVE